ncbi:cyclic pyranopterin monophosphate synthase [Spirochaetia bacterium]|nr:cyclic pyranopterin monophosphate synthase [Spirochaetia bacterium]
MCGMKAVVDSRGRTIDYLRLSVTDRCNLRCMYCMPAGGVVWRPHSEILSFEETIRLCRILGDLGIRTIRVTGGEPLVRRGITGLFRELKTLPGIERLTMTTNGLLLDRYLDELDGMLDGINISLDTLDPERFFRITGQGPEGLAAILRGMDRTGAKGIPVKVNSVLIRGVNDEDLLSLAALAEQRAEAVRFIELMPLGRAASMEGVTGEAVMGALEKKYGTLRPWPGKLGNGPAVYYAIPGFEEKPGGKLGFINAMSRAFCGQCNRIRLGAEGLLQPCLAADTSLDLRTLLRSGVSDGGLADAIEAFAAKKPQGHGFEDPCVCGAETATLPVREMFRIGG